MLAHSLTWTRLRGLTMWCESAAREALVQSHDRSGLIETAKWIESVVIISAEASGLLAQ